MNIQEKADLLRQLPNDALMQLMQTGSPEAESWLIASEVGRRNRLRDGGKVGTGAPPTVAQQLTQQIGQQQPTPTQIPQPGAQSQPRGLGSMMAQSAPKGYAAGGIVTFADGGEVTRLTVARKRGYKGPDNDEAAIEQYLATTPPLPSEQLDTAIQSYLARTPAASARREALSSSLGVGIDEAGKTFGSAALAPMYAIADIVGISTNRTPAATPAATPAVTSPTAPPVTPPVTQTQQDAAARAAAERQVQPGLGTLAARNRPEAIKSEDLRFMANLAPVDVIKEREELAKYYGEDEYGKAVAADIESRKAEATKSRGGLDAQTWINLGLGAMTAGSESGATFLGSVGKAGKEALAARREREKEISAEEAGIRQAGLSEVGRKQTEKRGYTTAAIAKKESVEATNRQLEATKNQALNELKKTNVELAKDLYNIDRQVDAQLASAQKQLDLGQMREFELALTSAQAHATSLQKEYLTLYKDNPTGVDTITAKQVYEAAQKQVDKMAAKLQQKIAPVDKPTPGTGKVIARATKER